MIRPNTTYDAWVSLRNKIEEHLYQIELAYKGDPEEMPTRLDEIKTTVEDLEAHIPNMQNLAREQE
jgi:hypothetical protein